MIYPPNNWIISPTIIESVNDVGGIWCCQKLSSAKSLKRYYESRYGCAKIYECEMGSILFQNSYRTKTDRIKFGGEVKI